jgi:hypothetical protein
MGPPVGQRRDQACRRYINKQCRHGAKGLYSLSSSQVLQWSLFLPLELRRQGDQVLAALQQGKLASRGQLNAVAPDPLVHIEDQLTKRRFLVDMGASFSIHPYSSKAAPMSLLYSVLLPTSSLAGGEKSISLQFNNKILPGPSSWLLCHFLLSEWFFKDILNYLLTQQPIA